MGKLGFGELELSILQTVQKLGRATVRNVYASLGSEGSYTMDDSSPTGYFPLFLKIATTFFSLSFVTK